MSGKLFLSLVLLCVGAMARAGSLSVNPVRIDLSHAVPTAALQVTNDAATPTVVQLALYAWTQQNGKSMLTPTRALLATPPIFTLPAHGTQTLRVGLLTTPDPRLETAYRLIVTQVPPKPRPGFRGLQLVLRMSIPVFVAPLAGKAAPKLVWHVHRLGGNKLELSVANTGTAHARLLSLSLAARAGGPALARIETGTGYLLAGAHRDWTLSLGRMLKPGQALVLRGKTPQGAFVVSLGTTR